MSDDTTPTMRDRIAALEARVAEMESRLAEARGESVDRDLQIVRLTNRIDALEQRQVAKPQPN